MRSCRRAPALVPLTFDAALLAQFKDLSGVSVDAVVSCGKTRFDEALLFTHRGLSGPAILQISSYWREGEDIVVDMAPGIDVLAELKRSRRDHPRQELATALAGLLPKRLARSSPRQLQVRSAWPIFPTSCCIQALPR